MFSFEFSENTDQLYIWKKFFKFQLFITLKTSSDVVKTVDHSNVACFESAFETIQLHYC